MKSYLTVLFISSFSLLYAQDVSSTVTTLNIDDRLYEIYDKVYLEKLVEIQPFLIQRWNFFLDNAWFLADFPEGKRSDDYPVIAVDNVNAINILKLIKDLNLQRHRDKYSYYRLQGTNKHLVFYPVRDFTEQLNKYCGRSYK